MAEAKHAHESRDVSLRGIVIFGIALAVSVALSLLVVGVTTSVFRRQTQASAPPASPLSRGPVVPPRPRLQSNPPADMAAYRAAQQRLLDSYGWIDSSAGIVHIPIDQAKKLVLEQGLPTRASGPTGATP